MSNDKGDTIHFFVTKRGDERYIGFNPYGSKSFHSKPEKQKEDESRIAVYVNCASWNGIRSVLRFTCASTKLISWSFGLRNRWTLFSLLKTINEQMSSQPPHLLDKGNERNNLD